MYQLCISPLREDTFGKSTAYSSPTFITTLDSCKIFCYQLMVPSIDLEKQFFDELNHLSSSERIWSKIGAVIILLKYSEGLDAGMLAL